MNEAEGIDDLTLQAFLDGELDRTRAAEVEAWLNEQPAHKARLREWRAHDQVLRAIFDPILTEPAPQNIRVAARMAASRFFAAPRQMLLRAIAASLLLAFGATAGWLARGHSAVDAGRGGLTATIATRAMDAHMVYAADLRHPIEVPATEHEHLNAWLSRRVQQHIAAPDLASAGFSLLGGRLLADGGKPAALFMYEGPNGKRLTVLVAQNIGHRVADPKLSTRDDLKAMIWTEGPLMVAVTSDLGSDRLRGIGEIVSTSLKGKG